jgi:Domain of unknown function (DUF4407)
MLQTVPVSHRERGIFRFFCFIAGIDRAALRECPRSDRLLATHLGLALVVAFSFMFLACCFSLFPTFAHDPLSTMFVIIVAFLVAVTISLVDRLFFQADWFAQAQRQSDKKRTWGRWLVAGVRIGLSFSVAMVVAGFIELFMFRSDIEQQIERMHRRENSTQYDKIEQRKAELDAELLAIRRQSEDADEALRRARDREVSVRDPNRDDAPSDFDRELAKEEQNLVAKSALERSVRGEILRYQRDKSLSPVRPGLAPTAEYVQINDNLRAASVRLGRILTEKRAIEGRIQELAKLKRDARGEKLKFFHDGAEQGRVDRDAALAKYKEAAENRDKKLAEYTAFIMAQPAFVQIQKGLFAQVVAYDELKQAWPIWWKSFWTKIFIIFIEAAPVLAKILFSPSSVYAVIVSSRVNAAVSKVDEDAVDKELDIAIKERAAAGIKETDKHQLRAVLRDVSHAG